MINLFELMQKAQGGSAAEAMARQFGLSPPQAESAIDALLPAFALALQRQLQDPTQWPKLFQAFAGAQQQGMMEAAAKAFTTPAAANPDWSGMLFGSGDIARQIAGQAAAFSGVNPGVLQQMIPAMTSALMSGMGQAMAEQGMGAWMKAMGSQPAAPMGGMPANPFAGYAEMMGRMMGAGAAAQAPGTAPRPASDYMDPKAMGALINAMLGGKAAEPEPEPEPASPPPSSAELGLDAISQLVETGREVQESQFKAMQSIMDQMFKPDAGKA